MKALLSKKRPRGRNFDPSKYMKITDIILPILSRNLELRLDENKMTAEISDKVSSRKGTLP